MSLTAAQKTYLANMPVREQEKLKDLGEAKTKDILKEMIGDDTVKGKTQPPPKRKRGVHNILAAWVFDGDHDGCIVCGNANVKQSHYSLQCPHPCNSWVKQTNKEGDPLSCANCRQDMGAMVAYWGRRDDDGDRVYCHARASDCHGETVAGGTCGVCKRQADSLINLNRVGEEGSDNTLCGKCFGKARASELRHCQEGAIVRCNDNPFNTPEKKKRT